MKMSEMDHELSRKIANYTRRYLRLNIGGDPEYFIGTNRGKILNADAFLPGKEDPIVVPQSLARGVDDQNASKIFFDGIQGEMSVAFSYCREIFIENIKHCFKRLYKEIPNNHKIILKPSAKIQKKIIEKADPEARRFGCAPDFNAYTRTTNTPEMDASAHPFRYAGGHIHMGVQGVEFMHPDHSLVVLSKNPRGQLRMIKLLDLFVTIPTLQLDNSPNAKRRRSKYGKAGCFRPTPYGIEYRTPSCWWLKSPITVSLVTGLARLAWIFAENDLDIELMKKLKLDEDTIQGCINESDTKTVNAIWEKLRPYIVIAGYPARNPLHLGSVLSEKFFIVSGNYKGLTKLPKITGDKYVYSFAVFEYMLKNGLHSVIDKDVKKEWSGVRKPFDSLSKNGMIHGSFEKLSDNKDFRMFQQGLLDNLYK